MPKDPARTETALRERTEAAAKRFQELANKLSDRLMKLEEWLNSLPSNVAVAVQLPNQTEGDWVSVIYTVRVKGRWQIWTCLKHLTRESQIQEQHLASAALETKIAAVDGLTALLDAHVEAQESQAARIQDVHKKLDAVFRVIGLEEEEGH